MVQKNMVKNGLKQLKMHFKHPFCLLRRKKVWNGFDHSPVWKFPHFFLTLPLLSFFASPMSIMSPTEI